MNNEKGLISTLILLISFILVVVIVGGAIYLDSTDGWSRIGLTMNEEPENVDEMPAADTAAQDKGQEVVFVPYQSPDQLYQLQIPDFWTGEERDGAAIFYSYNPAEAQPEQRAKIEIGRVANPDKLTSTEWLAKNNIDATTAQQAIFGTVSGAMILQDNTEANPGDIKSVIYMPVNDQVIVVTAESFGGARDSAVQFFNAILNSWQWTGEVVSPDQTLLDEQAAMVDDGTVPAEDISDVPADVPVDETVNDGTIVDGVEEVLPPVEGEVTEPAPDQVLE